MVRNISEFPPEVLVHIFQFLDMKNKLKVCQVCKNWLKSFECPQFLSSIKIRITKNSFEAARLFSRMSRAFECFHFEGVPITDPVIEFLKKYSKQFVDLSFTRCGEGTDELRLNFEDEILHCDKLKSLVIWDSNIMTLFASLPSATSLKLRLTKSLSDYVLSKAYKSSFKLDALLLGSNRVCEDEDSMINYDDEETILTNASSFNLSFPLIKMLIGKNRSTLKVLNVLNLKLSAKSVVAISEMEGLRLENFLFPYTLEARHLSSICENQLSLKVLDLTFFLKDKNNAVSAVCRSLQNLVELTIKLDRHIDNCVIDIFQLKHLELLDLSDNSNISETSYRDAVWNLKTFKLRHLNLSCNNINDESLFDLLRQNRSIRYLNLTRTKISDRTLNLICANLILLEYLILDSCEMISDSGLTGEFEVYSGTLTPTPLHNLRYLKEFNLNRNSLITNSGCIKAFRFPNMESLSLRNCSSLMINGAFKAQLQRQNPRLGYFKICSHTNRRENPRLEEHEN